MTEKRIRDESQLKALPYRPGIHVGDAVVLENLRWLKNSDGTASALFRYGPGGRKKPTFERWHPKGPKGQLRDIRAQAIELQRLMDRIDIATHLKEQKAVAAAKAEAVKAAERAARQKEEHASLTFKKLWHAYLDAEGGGIRAKTLYDRTKRVERLAVPELGHRAVEGIAPKEVHALIAEVRISTPVQAERLYSDLQAVRGWAASVEGDKRFEDYFTSHDFVGRLPKRARVKATPRDRDLSGEEVGLFLRALREAPLEEDVRAVLHLQLLTAARVGELTAAEWRDFDLKAKTWTLPATGSKSKHRVIRPLSRQALAVLLALPSREARSAYLFPRPARKQGREATLRVDAVTAALAEWQREPGQGEKKATLRLQRGKYTSHDARRTAASHAARLGVAPHLIELTLGHKPQGVTAAHYQQYQYLAELAGAYQLVADEYDRLQADAGVEASHV